MIVNKKLHPARIIKGMLIALSAITLQYLCWATHSLALVMGSAASSLGLYEESLPVPLLGTVDLGSNSFGHHLLIDQ